MLCMNVGNAGSNGAGKSTLMRLLCGLDNRYAGHINYTFHAHAHPGRPLLSHGLRNLTDQVSAFSRRFFSRVGHSSYLSNNKTSTKKGHCSSQSLDNSDDDDDDVSATGSKDDSTTTSKRLIGWCPQTDALYEQLTVYEHVELYLQLLHLNPCASAIESHLRRVGLETHAHKRACELSGGE